MEERDFQVTDAIKDKVYEDAIRPFVGWFGKTGGALGHAIYASIGLPVEKWAQRKEEQYKRVSEQIKERISFIPEDEKIEPSFGTVQSIFEGLDSCLDEEVLQAGFVNLLGAAMDSRTATSFLKCHADTLRQLCPDEAKILNTLFSKKTWAFIDVRFCEKGIEGWSIYRRYVTDIGDFAQCEFPDDIPSYLVHLETLGLLRIDSTNWLVDEKIYDLLEKRVQDDKKRIEASGRDFKIGKGIFDITPLGEDFARSCGLSKF